MGFNSAFKGLMSVVEHKDFTKM